LQSDLLERIESVSACDLYRQLYVWGYEREVGLTVIPSARNQSFGDCVIQPVPEIDLGKLSSWSASQSAQWGTTSSEEAATPAPGAGRLGGP
jgi:hypothetical protein